MHEAYAEALYAESRGKPHQEQSEIAERFLALLEKRGHVKLLPKILRALTLRDLKEQDEAGIKVVLASPAHLTRFTSDIARAEDAVFGGKKERKIKIDSSLVGGFVLEKGGLRFDASFKRKLLSLFKTLTVTHS